MSRRAQQPMGERRYAGFTGLDVRRHVAASDPRTARVASNVELTVGMEYRTRPGLRLVATVDTNSVGLYSAEGMLRVAVPGGQSLQDSRPANIYYDPVGDGSAYALGSLAKVHAVEVIGGAGINGAKPYIVLERSTGVLEHHWLTEVPASAATAVNTRVSLAFDPGKVLGKAAGSLYADDPANGVLRKSSAANGPRDWTARADAAFFAVRNYAAGDVALQALGIFHHQLAVLFADSTQLWTPSPDPAKMSIGNVLNGPGTIAPKAVENVLGDLFYFSRGGFRSMSVATVTGEPKEGDIGARIQALTDGIDFTDARGVWSQSRSQYLCAVGTTVWAYTYSPLYKVTGWTTWTLPVSVDYIVEHQGDVYIRSGTSIYVLDQTLGRDDGQSSDIAWDLRLPFVDLDAPGRPKRWKFLDMVQTGTSHLKFYLVPGDDTKYVTGPTWTGPTYGRGPLMMNQMADAISLGFSGTGIWKLSNYAVRFDVLAGGL